MERKTKQRDAILDVLAEEGRPLSTQEILDRAQKKVPKLGIATVYRAVKEFVDSDQITVIALPGDPSQRYELKGKHHHHHFWCRICEKMFEMEGCPGKLNIKAPKGFKTETHEVIFRGLCASCRIDG